MPRQQIEHSAGQTLDPQIKQSLLAFFDKQQLEKLEERGGRVIVRVNLTKRERGRGRRNDGKTLGVDEGLVEALKAARTSEERMRELLSGLRGKELRRLGEIVHLRFRSKSKVADMKHELINLFQHGELWQRISNA